MYKCFRNTPNSYHLLLYELYIGAAAIRVTFCPKLPGNLRPDRRIAEILRSNLYSIGKNYSVFTTEKAENTGASLIGVIMAVLMIPSHGEMEMKCLKPVYPTVYG